MKDEGLDDDERENKQTALSTLPFTRVLVCTPSLISLFAELLCFLKLFFPDSPSFFFCFFDILCPPCPEFSLEKGILEQFFAGRC